MRFPSVVLAIFFAYCVEGKVYKPCKLAQEINNILSANAERARYDPSFSRYAQYFQILPTLVCIAGYHNYNTSNEYSLGDGYYREGIFGLVRPKGTLRRQEFLDDDIENDFFEFLEKVFFMGDKMNPMAMNFYNGACNINEKHTYNVYCYLNPYVFGSYPIPVPKDPSYLHMLYQDP